GKALAYSCWALMLGAFSGRKLNCLSWATSAHFGAKYQVASTSRAQPANISHQQRRVSRPSKGKSIGTPGMCGPAAASRRRPGLRLWDLRSARAGRSSPLPRRPASVGGAELFRPAPSLRGKGVGVRSPPSLLLVLRRVGLARVGQDLGEVVRRRVEAGEP